MSDTLILFHSHCSFLCTFRTVVTTHLRVSFHLLLWLLLVLNMAVTLKNSNPALNFCTLFSKVLHFYLKGHSSFKIEGVTTFMEENLKFRTSVVCLRLCNNSVIKNQLLELLLVLPLPIKSHHIYIWHFKM